MKTNLKTFFFVFMAAFCSSMAQNTADENLLIKNEVHKVLDNWHKAAANANYENYFNAMDTVSVFVGTDAKEVWSKKEFQDFSKPYFDKGKAWRFKAVARNIYVHHSGEIAWFDELLDTWMGVCRGSGVLEKVADDWKIKHYVLSVAVPNEDIQPIITIKKERDSLFLKGLDLK